MKMTGIELLKDTKVSYYGKVTYNHALCEITLFDWITKYSLKNKSIIENIRHMYDIDKKKAKQMKSDNLPCITISGVFKGYRNAKECNEFNSVIAIDIDKDENTTITDWENIKMKIASLPYVFLTSYSCSGKGLYCLIYFNKQLNFIKVFNAIKKDFFDMGINIDKNCCDITRLRFVSYDDNLLIRTSEVEMYNKEYEIQYETHNKNNNSNINIQFAFKAISYLILEDKYRSNTYQNWLLDGFRLATLGDIGKLLFMYLSKVSDNYDENAATRKFEECVRTTTKEPNSISYYYKLLKDKHGNKWIDIVNSYNP